MSVLEPIYLANVALYMKESTELMNLIKVSSFCKEGIQMLHRCCLFKNQLSQMKRIIPRLSTIEIDYIDQLLLYKNELETIDSIILNQPIHSLEQIPVSLLSHISSLKITSPIDLLPFNNLKQLIVDISSNIQAAQNLNQFFKSIRPHLKVHFIVSLGIEINFFRTIDYYCFDKIIIEFLNDLGKKSFDELLNIPFIDKKCTIISKSQTLSSPNHRVYCCYPLIEIHSNKEIEMLELRNVQECVIHQRHLEESIDLKKLTLKKVKIIGNNNIKLPSTIEEIELIRTYVDLSEFHQLKKMTVVGYNNQIEIPESVESVILKHCRSTSVIFHSKKIKELEIYGQCHFSLPLGSQLHKIVFDGIQLQKDTFKGINELKKLHLIHCRINEKIEFPKKIEQLITTDNCIPQSQIELHQISIEKEGRIQLNLMDFKEIKKIEFIGYACSDATIQNSLLPTSIQSICFKHCCGDLNTIKYIQNIPHIESIDSPQLLLI
ncbi:hypothetical protein EHI8A_116750 [Entamoeba histolytica HM-1:IMSS-B]|uniref:Uncharacterized protein n=6 Tax=Entamoeba histolytica TaxID=5759 RepID=C4M0B3_ENTH1|nr:hypothetical protein EHI_064440 [Entamoeba histolytica HM-1:IMSS]EMD47967.1 Hypothetical protein EHI5A_160140 [Entamoeba histolytica KU27]EMH77199.1 hypothetical protein EHI8A_116750 [Entamoeba histolytica HM-1:IMSS-B]EMS11545.1 hypothetical protein KM1_189740 [Entamoeba histolytica HM-3:IMSS]ENY60250.1 hypothetical protein EHI7A_107900 [Entamoeba histolytica HM-1:IMSS-A]GAT94592.1 hypothetical protein CL6EHI_064440 [Entamoeba histolytica]|eukprot:XP_654014.1 hypothetical protein EHI_064440 [Entamoeba histolytica HM-1:IMSS]